MDHALRKTRAKLVIVDPIQSYLGPAVDLHRSNETRPVMDGLVRLAEEHDCAILLLRHLSKQNGGKAIHRGLGSIDLTGAVRSEMLAGSSPDNPSARALCHIKTNLSENGPTLGYAIDGEGCFAWTGRSEITAKCWLRRVTRKTGVQWKMPVNGSMISSLRAAKNKRNAARNRRRPGYPTRHSAVRKKLSESILARPDCPALGSGSSLNVLKMGRKVRTLRT